MIAPLELRVIHEILIFLDYFLSFQDNFDIFILKNIFLNSLYQTYIFLKLFI
jgi:hypothetical protein